VPFVVGMCGGGFFAVFFDNLLCRAFFCRCFFSLFFFGRNLNRTPPPATSRGNRLGCVCTDWGFDTTIVVLVDRRCFFWILRVRDFVVCRR
jgi:hypothetical protein